ncbi:MAG: SPASM domain-containing protein [Vallitalea sp.]|jgi:radical SAM protein with 4Fe4S-binding SPASM domain|nr:SPASM domain-containing protein [Vallitalea sp.]
MIVNPYKNTLGRIKVKLEKKHPVAFEKYILPYSLASFDRLYTRLSKKRGKKYLSQDKFPLFQTIEIETINRCNGKCSFCPINSNIDPRPFKMMDKTLFCSIIDQLSEINYEGSIGLYSNNEPLLDNRLFEFLDITRKKLPNATLYLFTNGSLLTTHKFDKLMEYLDWITIDNYNDNLILNKPVEEVYEHALSKPYKNKVHIYLRKENEILLNRSGQADNRSSKRIKLKSTCLYPFEQVVIRPDGKLSLCCNDATGKVTMGDLTKDTLLDIWYGEKYTNIRYNMLKNRSLNYLCKDCDIVTPRVPAGTSFKIKNIITMFKKAS